jgi:SAM-dependent methyltransferase
MTDTSRSGPEYSLRLSDAEVQRYRMMAETAMKDEADIWQLAGIQAGAAVADIGCGPGAMLQVLSERVGPTGSVIAIDGDVPSAAAAQALVDTAGLTNVTVRGGRADDTGLEPGSLDVVMMRHVLAHNGDAEQRIVDHVAKLVRPGGAVFLVDADGLAIRVRPADPDVDDLLARYRELLALKGCDFMTGLRLDELLSAAGLEVLEFRGRYAIIDVPPGVRPPAWAARDAMVAAGIATEDDLARWQAALERADTRKTRIFAPSFAAVGRRPA